MNYQTIRLEQKKHIALLTINKPEALNALDDTVLSELNHAVGIISTDDSIQILIITGQGKSFVAGADISVMRTMNPDEARAFSKKGQDLFRKIELMEKPVIAAINGFALGGGCELALCCDIRIASEKSKFGQPEVNLGVIPGFGGTQRLSRIVGIAKAKELIYTGDMIVAEEAATISLVNQVVPADSLLDCAFVLAEKILTRSQKAVQFAKTAINRGYECDIETGLSIENDLFSLCFAHEDQREGMNAFIEKRPAIFDHQK